jgi:predicted dehydrogenase
MVPMAASAPVRIGVVGTGGMGRHHVRLLSELPGAELVGIHDADPEAGQRMVEQHGARLVDDLDALAAEVEAMVVAVPTVAHTAIACDLLEKGIHILVEKPIAGSLEEADRIVTAAESAGRVLAVGHVEFFNPAVQSLLGLLEVGLRPGFVEIQRLAAFTPRSLDVDVILDLMIHDLQILHALDPSPVKEVRATGIGVLTPKIDIANARIALESGCVANITASRVSSERVRKLRLFGRSSYYSLDYQDQEIKGYRLADDPALTPEERLQRLHPEVEKGEPLKAELEAFLAACRGENAPIVTGHHARRALATALSLVEAARG